MILVIKYQIIGARYRYCEKSLDNSGKIRSKPHPPLAPSLKGLRGGLGGSYTV